jgi:hypothetical protein
MLHRIHNLLLDSFMLGLESWIWLLRITFRLTTVGASQ